MYRQGDVLLVRVDEIPIGLKPLSRRGERIVLALGEVGGHAHAILSPHAVGFGRSGQTEPAYLVVEAETVDLEHEEHATICIPRGVYRVVRQREYSEFGGYHGFAYVWD